MCLSFNHRVHILVKMKQGQCICPLSWSVHCNFIGEGKCNERGVGVHPPPSPTRTDFTLITECTPESSHCNSVYSVVLAGKLLNQRKALKAGTVNDIQGIQYACILDLYTVYDVPSYIFIHKTSKDSFS